MKKTLILFILLQYIHASEVEIFEGREGFKFGLGIAALGGCEKEEILDEEGNFVDTEKYCEALPWLDLEIGYNISNQFGVSLDVKTLLLVSTMGIKAKYYMKDARDTAFISLTGGVLNVGNGHSGFIGSYNHIEYGYAYGKNEFSIGVGAQYGHNSILAHIGYKYIF